MDVFARIAEEKIKEAIKRGELDHLPGMGEPLNLKDDLPGLSPELKMGYRMLKNAGYVPEEIDQLRREMVTLEDLIAGIHDEGQKNDARKKLNQKKLRFHELVKRRNLHSNSKFGSYAHKIYDLFS